MTDQPREEPDDSSWRARHPFVLFCFIAFGFSWALWIAMWVLFRDHVTGFKVAAMFGPALAFVLIRGWITREGFADAGLGLGLKRMYLVAWLSMPLVSSLAMAAAVALGQGSWGLNLEPAVSASAFLGPPEGLTPGQTVACRVGLDLTVNMLIVLPLTLGEDLGWFGYAVPKLLGRFGKVRTAWLFGLLWASWHLPVAAMGHNNPDRSLVGLIVAMVFLALPGVWLAWLRIVSRSLWVPALAHACMDSATTLPFLWVRDASVEAWGISDLAFWLVVAVAVSIHLKRSKSQQTGLTRG